MKKSSIFKKTALSLLSTSLLAVSLAIPVAAEGNNGAVNSFKAQMKYDVEQYAEKLKPYVIKNPDGTITLDESYKDKVTVPKEVVKGITGWMQVINEDVKAGQAIINQDLEVIYKNQPTQKYAAANSGGVDDVKVYWWGFGLYLSHSTTEKLVDAMKYGATATKLASLILKYVWTPQTKVAEAIAEVATWVLASGALVLYSNDEGNGVLITVTWPSIVSGIEPQ